MTQGEAVAVRRFEADPKAARAARLFARECLEPYGEPAADTGELLVSELATNVIKHAATPFVVDVSVAGGVATVGVADSIAVDLRVTAADGDATSGRGLQLLDALAVRWGVERTADGKRVWFEVAVDSPGD